MLHRGHGHGVFFNARMSCMDAADAINMASRPRCHGDRLFARRRDKSQKDAHEKNLQKKLHLIRHCATKTGDDFTPYNCYKIDGGVNVFSVSCVSFVSFGLGFFSPARFRLHKISVDCRSCRLSTPGHSDCVLSEPLLDTNTSYFIFVCNIVVDTKYTQHTQPTTHNLS